VNKNSEPFRLETRSWLELNCPESMRSSANLSQLSYGGQKAVFENPEAKLWMDRMAGKGWTVPQWPEEYGGAGLNDAQAKILKEEMQRLECRPPLVGHGVWMLGPALLEFGNEAQKSQHLPRIARGEIRWCQGYSEPGAGSDLASLRCRAELEGDNFTVNGSKTWTTDADKADWIFCLVRTDPSVKKQEGISFLLIDMSVSGVDVKPIVLIGGETDFCETFFDNVCVPKTNLVGEINKGWSIAKALLAHERTMMSDLQAYTPTPEFSLAEIAQRYRKSFGADKSHEVAHCEMRRRALSLTQQRIFEESRAGQQSAAGLTMKLAATEQDKCEAELVIALLGTDGLGWEGEGFEDYQLRATRSWLMSKGLTLGGGTSEVQLNLIAKLALGLPG
jgi:acyl-CoA dehydrogenase